MTLHIPGTGPAHDPARAHLYVIINDPCANGLNLLVPLSSTHANCDRTCVLTTGHEFIRWETHALYARAETVETQRLRQSVEAEIIEYRGLFAETEFVAIRDGVLVSPHTKPRVKAYFRDFCQ